MMLKDSKHKGNLTWSLVTKLVKGALGKDENGYRAELMSLVSKAQKAR